MTFYLNLAVYLLEDFLANTQSPAYGGSFTYGRPLKRHGWEPTTNAELVKTMARFVAAHAPAGPAAERAIPHSRPSPTPPEPNP